MSADVRDILDIERANTPELTRETFLATKKRNFERAKNASKRPEGMHREVFALLYNDNKDGPPLLPDNTVCVDNSYKQAKARLGMRKVRKWEWAPFTNPARTDNAIFHHWKRVGEKEKEYVFAKFNKHLEIPSYTMTDYNAHLRTNTQNWNKAQTDHLFDLAKQFDLRFIVMADRWDREQHGTKTVEDLKERYYEVVGLLTKARGQPSDKKTYVYDGDHERRRKDQLKKLFDRTLMQVEEEQMLLNELKKIEARKKERERKTQDLQKLISQADQVRTNMWQIVNINHLSDAASNTPSTRKYEKKLHKKKLHHQPRPSKVDSVVNAIEVGTSGIKFADLRGSGVSLRSQKMKLPANIGQRKVKALEQCMQEFKVDPAPPPTEDICNSFNEMRSDMVLLGELRTALNTCIYEIESLKHQYEAACPGKSLSIPPTLKPPVTVTPETAEANNSTTTTTT
ncbi:DNA methyltransferase 1-associated protein 1-like isoform X1 [Teleopsis dalmanni]|uniref:DNA methyltransferase 1-associated protein 1-like isoform X1 n=1 Tax=Teleopsis dalmanni TaxID=139649 RepID=UPI0018CDD6FF|nr:DNA methyltransferase 1-associated protein 1-like isoform X1 [Teleopsis dalmanni]XP_037954122.1 DNA methyltransferase 1-associated protein 1-like isoform X1 [Teleopsis dalmanni]